MKKCDLQEFACTQCGFCCKKLKRYAVMLFPEDITKLSNSCKITEAQFIKRYCEYKDIAFADECLHICFLKTDHTDCPFLTENRCSVHSEKPIQCSRTPYHFFAYYDIWGYMPCVEKEGFPEGNSEKEDILLVKQLMRGL